MQPGGDGGNYAADVRRLFKVAEAYAASRWFGRHLNIRARRGRGYHGTLHLCVWWPPDELLDALCRKVLRAPAGPDGQCMEVSVTRFRSARCPEELLAPFFARIDAAWKERETQ